MPQTRRTALPFLGLLLCTRALADACPAPGQWLDPHGEPLAVAPLMAELAKQEVVLLGERHDQASHHRWQLHTLAGLHAHRPGMTIGLEMLSREAQPVLDAWVEGELSEAAFLEESGWDEAWGLDPTLYLPILHFARMQRLPLLALNVDPGLRRRLARGWDDVPADERHAISSPAEPPKAYRDRLADAYAEHDGGDDPAGLEAFVAAQLVWDRAMAAGLAEAREDDRLVVGLVGLGHVVHGHGIPHQLADLGVEAQTSLLPWTPAADCRPEPGLADALYVIGDRVDTVADADPRRERE
jgi:uncharacterized iron-regulated protein